MPSTDDWDDRDDEGVDDDDVGDDLTSDGDLLACPSCRRAVHEDTQRCPHCGDWIVPVEAGGHGKRLLLIVTAILLILAMMIPVMF